MTEGALLIFLQSGVEKWETCQGIKHTTLDLSPQSGAYDLSATARQPQKITWKMNHFIKTLNGLGQPDPSLVSTLKAQIPRKPKIKE